MSNQKEKDPTKYNYLYNILYRLSICILPLVVTPYIARTLGSEGNGLYSFSSCVACYFIMFAKLGLDQYGNRSIALCAGDAALRSKTFCEIYAMQLITSVGSILIYLLLVYTVFWEQRLIYFMQLLYVLSAMFDVSWFFYGMERFKLTTLRSVGIRILIVLCVYAFVHSEEDLWIYTLILSASFLLEQLLLLPFVKRYVKPVKPRWAEIWKHFLPNVKLFLPLAALSVYNWMDKLMLGFMKGNEVVSYYTYAENIINLPKGIVAALGTVMLPGMSRLAAEKKLDSCIRNLKKSMDLICFLSCALCFGIAGVASVFVPFFLGPAYQQTISLTVGLALVMIPMSLVDVIQSQYLVPFYKEKVYILSVSLGAVVNLSLNALCIPYFSAKGAVIGTIGAELSVCICQMYSIRKLYHLKDLYRSLAPFFLCGIVEYVVVSRLGSLPFHPMLTLVCQVAAGGVVYLICCAAVIFFWRRDLKEGVAL